MDHHDRQKELEDQERWEALTETEREELNQWLDGLNKQINSGSMNILQHTNNYTEKQI